MVNNGDGTFTYTPAAGFNGSDSFTYTITDHDGETSTATVTITVTPVNDVPAAAADSYSTHEDTAFTTGNVLTNDTLGDTPTTITAFDALSTNGGTVVNNGDGTFTYTPAADFNGSDSFTYTITDTDGETSTATVTIAVTPVNDAPIAVADSYRVTEGEVMTIIGQRCSGQRHRRGCRSTDGRTGRRAGQRFVESRRRRFIRLHTRRGVLGQRQLCLSGQRRQQQFDGRRRGADGGARGRRFRGLPRRQHR